MLLPPRGGSFLLAFLDEAEHVLRRGQKPELDWAGVVGVLARDQIFGLCQGIQGSNAGGSTDGVCAMGGWGIT